MRLPLDAPVVWVQVVDSFLVSPRSSVHRTPSFAPPLNTFHRSVGIFVVNIHELWSANRELRHDGPLLDASGRWKLLS
jgi:hypothetical protein